MASEDPISSGRKSPADSRGDIRMPAQRNGRRCHTGAEAMLDGSVAQYALKRPPLPEPANRIRLRLGMANAREAYEFLKVV